MRPGLKFAKIVVVFTLLVGATVLYKVHEFPRAKHEDPNAKQRSALPNDFRLQTVGNETSLSQVERFLVIMITTAPFHVDQRQAIRHTWLKLLANNSVALRRSNLRSMRDPANSTNHLVIQYWFICGHYYDDEGKVETAVENETQAYGDMLRLQYTEQYSLLAYKTLRSLMFASTIDVKFIVKVDDDVYLHVPRLIWWLTTEASLPEKLYAGKVWFNAQVIRNHQNKYYVSEQDFNETFYPPYCSGPFYVLSKEAAVELLTVAFDDWLNSFPIEDAYMGILARKVGIKPLNVAGERIRLDGGCPPADAEKTWPDLYLNRIFVVGHCLSIERLHKFHQRFLKLPLRPRVL